MSPFFMRRDKSHAIAPPGEYVSMRDRKVHLLRAYAETAPDNGSVVFESALGCPLTEWVFLQLHLAKYGYTSYAYDRPGVGWTAPVPRAQSIQDHGRDLEELIGRLHVNSSSIVVGHSVGGLLATHFAARHPQRVKGLVLIDASHPKMMLRSARQHNAIETLRRGLRRSLRNPIRKDQRSSRSAPWPEYLTDMQGNSPAGVKGMLDELRAWDKHWQSWPDDLEALQEVPLLVITAGSAAEQDPSHMQLQEDLSTLSRLNHHILIKDATHRGLVMDFDNSLQIARAMFDFFHPLDI